MTEKKTERLLHTKLMPPRLHPAVIPRGELLGRLDAGLSCKLILVSAPTGYGKTTLVRQWLAGKDLPSAWLTLDEYDNDPVRFWTYFVSALRTLDASLGKTALPSLTASQRVSFPTFLTALINELAGLDQSYVLVLDDFHTIKAPEILERFSYLLRRLPASLCLVLLARADPHLPLGILRARDELVELDSASLRFTPAETQRFLQESGLKIAPDVLAQLEERAQGWAAGLRLAARSLQEGNGKTNESFLESFSGSQRYVADYLIEEVFETQPPVVQDFLLQTCFLEQLTGSLCEAVTGDRNSGALLTQLDRGNLFLAQLETGGERAWYRYAPLFAESIQHLARQRLGEQAVEGIYAKASAWYEAQGLYDEAIQAALEAKLTRQAVALIERFIEIHELSEMHTLGRWLERLPQEEILRHPEICFAYAQILLYSAADRFAPETASRLEPYLQAAETQWRQPDRSQQLGELLSFRGIIAWWQGDFQKAYHQARRSLELIPEHDLIWRGNSLLIASNEALNAGRILDAEDEILEARALMGAAQNLYGTLAAIQILGEVFYGQGELEQAEQLSQQILAEAVGDASMLDDQAIASLMLANIAYERNQLELSRRRAGRALELAQQRGNAQVETRATLRLTCIDAARDDFPRARERLKSLEAGIRLPALLREIQEAQARLAILSGDLRSIAGWQAHIQTEPAAVSAGQEEREAFTLARLRLAEGKVNEALEILKGRAAEAAANGRLRSQVTALCLEALAYQASSDSSHARGALVEALSLGQAKGLRRLFLDEGRRFAALLQALLASIPQRSLSLYAAALLHSFHTESVEGQVALAPVEPLSPGELRVLRLLVAGLTNREIAQELVLSVNTVKTHLKSIFRKLNARSREEARQAARELRLF